MINVSIPGDHLPERVYAVHVLLYEFLGLNYSINSSEGNEHYVLQTPALKIIVEDHFFSQFTARKTYLEESVVPRDSTTCTSDGIGGLELIWGRDFAERTDDQVVCGVDIFAGAFFMLTRWEEYVSNVRDTHDRFPARASLAFRAGFLNRPVVNEYAAFLKKEMLAFGVPNGVFKENKFGIYLTCDVDFPKHWTGGVSDLRKMAGTALRAASPKAAVRDVSSLLKSRRSGTDPYDTFDYLMEKAEEAGHPASFFFMAGGQHKLDPGSSLSSEEVSNLIDRILAAGHEVGLHPSYLTASDPEMFASEVEVFTSVVGKVQSGRQHYLRMEVPFTWRLWEQSGAVWDSTMGYAEQPGFRCGCCMSFPVFDIEARRMLRLYERPLIVMDVSLKNYLNLSADEAIEMCTGLKEETARHGGEFLVLWHNSSFENDGWEKYEEVFLKLMET